MNWQLNNCTKDESIQQTHGNRASPQAQYLRRIDIEIFPSGIGNQQRNQVKYGIATKT
jgi:hypothetical protein